MEKVCGVLAVGAMSQRLQCCSSAAPLQVVTVCWASAANSTSCVWRHFMVIL